MKPFIKILIISIIAISIIGVGGYLAFNAGYMPLSQFLETKTPAGNYNIITPTTDIDIEQIIENNVSDCSLLFGALIQTVPDINKLKCEFFETDVVTDVVINDYKSELKSDGYELYASGTETYLDRSVQYIVYNKGMTAVGVLATSQGCCNSCIFYSTGCALTYKDIYGQIQDQFE